ncbi:hypothetical protein [Nocardioides limicola]|uniref:hypothetical protein n=1 Tax=Nocardioides limicola TaxID=2803368 RepID=UPI00193BE7E0|nr:hypothetical protein [Nocardioides sp. DJM-14]
MTHLLNSLAIGLCAALLVGCGAQARPAPVELVPALSGALTLIGADVAAGDHDRARGSISDLIVLVEAAVAAGELTAAEAEPILTAAARLRQQLPESEPEPEPEPSSPTGAVEPEPDKPGKPGKPGRPDNPGKGKGQGQGKGR